MDNSTPQQRKLQHLMRLLFLTETGIKYHDPVAFELAVIGEQLGLLTLSASNPDAPRIQVGRTPAPTHMVTYYLTERARNFLRNASPEKDASAVAFMQMVVAHIHA